MATSHARVHKTGISSRPASAVPWNAPVIPLLSKSSFPWHLVFATLSKVSLRVHQADSFVKKGL